jgi:hypothetical protein
MLLGFDALTVAGVIVGFGLWLALIFAVYRWGPFEREDATDPPPAAPDGLDRPRGNP